MTDSIVLNANASLSILILKDKRNNAIAIKHSKHAISNKTHISKTDPEATLAYKSGSPRTLKYKAHVTSDSSNRIIWGLK